MAASSGGASSSGADPPDIAATIRNTRRGGRVQRHQARVKLAHATASSTEPDADFDSELVLHLLRQWSWGQISAAELQRLAYKAYQDEINLLKKLNQPEELGSKSLKSMAGVGTFGKNPGNIQKELLLILGQPEIPEPFQTKIHVVVQKPRVGRTRMFKPAVQLVSQSFLLPQVMFYNQVLQ